MYEKSKGNETDPNIHDQQGHRVGKGQVYMKHLFNPLPTCALPTGAWMCMIWNSANMTPGGGLPFDCFPSNGSLSRIQSSQDAYKQSVVYCYLSRFQTETSEGNGNIMEK